MAQFAESNEDRLQLDGKILEEQLEGLATVLLVSPGSSADLQVGMHVAFLDVDSDSPDRFYGSITSVLNDTQVGLMFDRMAIALQVDVNHETDDPSAKASPDVESRIIGGHG